MQVHVELFRIGCWTIHFLLVSPLLIFLLRVFLSPRFVRLLFHVPHHHHAVVVRLLFAENWGQALAKIRHKQGWNWGMNWSWNVCVWEGRTERERERRAGWASFGILDECLMIQSAFCVLCVANEWRICCVSTRRSHTRIHSKAERREILHPVDVFTFFARTSELFFSLLPLVVDSRNLQWIFFYANWQEIGLERCSEEEGEENIINFSELFSPARMFVERKYNIFTLSIRRAPHHAAMKNRD